MDSWQGPWTAGINAGSGNFSGTTAALAPGFHTIYAFATDGEDATSTITGLQSDPLVGSIQAYGFVVPSSVLGLKIVNTSLPPNQIGTPYSQTLVAIGGTPPFTWALTSGTLPAGLNLNASTGVISGTPTALANATPLTFQAADSSTPTAQTAAVNLTLTITSTPPLVITTASLPSSQIGTLYSQTLAATGGTTPYTWSVTSGTLPAGLNLNASTGVISGTPTALANTTPLTFQASDSSSTQQTATVNLTLTITATAPFTITTTSLPNGAVGMSYSQMLTATGGNVPYMWSITSGTLPAGLTLGAASGVISGTPTAAVSAQLTIQVMDSSSRTASANLSLTTVSPFILSPGATSLSISALGGSGSTTVTITPAGGYTGTVTLSCSVNYTGQGTPNNAPTCSLSPAQVTLSGTAVTSTLTIKTTAASTALWQPRSDWNRTAWLGGTELALAVGMLVGMLSRNKWQRAPVMALLLLLMFVGAFVGCGGGGGGGGSSSGGSSSGGGSSGGGSSGTTVGGYNVVVSATAGSMTSSATIPLSVQ